QIKSLTRQVFGPLPTCVYRTQPDFAAAANYQDLWWASPAGSESGWGVNLTHQGDTIFATWFTYDHDRTPMWLVATAPKIAPRAYAGTLYRLTGPPFNAAPVPPIGSPGGAVGLRPDAHFAHDRGRHRARHGRNPRCRQAVVIGPIRRSARAAQHEHDLPELRGVAAHDRSAECRLRPENAVDAAAGAGVAHRCPARCDEAPRAGR